MSVRRDTTGSYVLGLGGLTLAIFFVLSLLAPNFLTLANLNSMGSQFPEFGLLALAVLPTMISGGIDLSVVAVANLASIVAALILRAGPEYAWVAVPAALLLGLACGLLNGCLIAYLRLPPILATLGTLQLFGGIGIVITGGPAITGIPEWYGAFGNASIGGAVPVPLLVFVLVALGLGLVLRFTATGMRARLYGANPLAARFVGMPDKALILRIYAIAGVISALAGLVILARVNSANADYGGSYLLLVILINILAGVSPFGGSGTVVGIVLAVVTLQLISSGLNFLAFTAFARDLVFGGLLILVMAARVVADGGWIPRWRTRRAKGTPA
ncbi:ABC transporter permease [Antarcticirhabdus aurantiaca]|uniref:ABC transporter permease n=1 Tax=Antarcticirhabdus aurantiaca TaxID=2606717 RepID=A0ACD4NS06_9HYPH|nr:ABC transporter permease [Antarcticirhabdus aurantiaca]WAJ29699.1 ABC transporter permease [Jeongeuplla avenae]